MFQKYIAENMIAIEPQVKLAFSNNIQQVVTMVSSLQN